MLRTRNNSMERPKWIDELISGRTEWVLYDSDTQRLKTTYADNQKEAIKEAISHDIVPRRTQDVYPRMGGHTKTIMTPQEFESFMSQIRR